MSDLADRIFGDPDSPIRMVRTWDMAAIALIEGRYGENITIRPPDPIMHLTFVAKAIRRIKGGMVVMTDQGYTLTIMKASKSSKRKERRRQRKRRNR